MPPGIEKAIKLLLLPHLLSPRASEKCWGDGIQRYTWSVVYRMYYSYLLGRYGPVLPLNSEHL